MQRFVNQLPIVELWNDVGPISATHIRDLTRAEIRDLLQASQVHFVVANMDSPLKWIPQSECYRFWKTEVQPRVADPSGTYAQDFPDEYFYFASEWTAFEDLPIVLLSKAH